MGLFSMLLIPSPIFRCAAKDQRMHFWLVLRAGQDSVAVPMEAGLDRAAIDELIRTGAMRQAKSREEVS